MTAVPAHRADATLDLAQELLAGVRAEAQRRGVAMGAAVVDAGGNLVAALRMDGAQLVALPLAIDKAWTAVALDAPTETWAASTAPGGSSSSRAACRCASTARPSAGSASAVRPRPSTGPARAAGLTAAGLEVP